MRTRNAVLALAGISITLAAALPGWWRFFTWLPASAAAGLTAGAWLRAARHRGVHAGHAPAGALAAAERGRVWRPFGSMSLAAERALGDPWGEPPELSDEEWLASLSAAVCEEAAGLDPLASAQPPAAATGRASACHGDAGPAEAGSERLAAAWDHLDGITLDDIAAWSAAAHRDLDAWAASRAADIASWRP